MPYIAKQDRVALDKWLAKQPSAFLTFGQINYLVTRLILQQAMGQTVDYCWYQGMIGMLECVKAELIERGLRPYEKKKREANGDIEGW